MDCVNAFVLHTRPYRESSQLVELLTAEQGRLGVIARGNRGVRRANPLQSFQHYRIVLSGRGELRRAHSIESTSAPCLPAGRTLYAVLYLNELLMRLLHRDVPMPGVFMLYGEILETLRAGAQLEPALRRFEKQLLDELGYGHRYAETVAGAAVEKTLPYTFDPDHGVKVADAGRVDSQCFRGSALLALESGVFSPDQPDDLRDAKRLMRRALAPYLGDKPLKSRDLFRRVRLPGMLAVDVADDPAKSSSE